MRPGVRRLIVALAVVVVALWLGSLQGDGTEPAGAGTGPPGDSAVDPSVPAAVG